MSTPSDPVRKLETRATSANEKLWKKDEVRNLLHN